MTCVKEIQPVIWLSGSFAGVFAKNWSKRPCAFSWLMKCSSRTLGKSLEKKSYFNKVWQRYIWRFCFGFNFNFTNRHMFREFDLLTQTKIRLHAWKKVCNRVCSVRNVSKHKTRSRQFHTVGWILLDQENWVRLRFSVKTGTGFVTPQMKEKKWSKAKYNAKNSLLYKENFNSVVIQSSGTKETGA